MNNRIARVPRHIQNGQARTKLLRLPTELSAIRTRHNDIGEDQIDWLRAIFQQQQRSFCACDCAGHIAESTQYLGNICPQVGVIFNKEDDLAVLARGNLFIAYIFDFELTHVPR